MLYLGNFKCNNISVIIKYIWIQMLSVLFGLLNGEILNQELTILTMCDFIVFRNSLKYSTCLLSENLHFYRHILLNPQTLFYFFAFGSLKSTSISCFYNHAVKICGKPCKCYKFILITVLLLSINCFSNYHISHNAFIVLLS